MNIKEFCLDEIELNQYFVNEGISAILHTILFIRAPNQNQNLVQPEDVHCERLKPLTYAKCGPCDIDQNVNDSLDMLQRFKSPVGPKIQKGIINLTFYEHREKEALFGWIHSKEKVYFERWKIPIVIDERGFEHVPRSSSLSSRSLSSSSDGGTEAIEAITRQHMYSHARNQVQQTLLAVLEVIN